MDNLIKKDFLKQLHHIRAVQDYMVLLELNKDKLPFKINDWELIQRALQHDIDKFSPELVNGYCNLLKYHSEKNIKHVDRNIVRNNNDIYNCCNIHYDNSRHHIEYHEKNNEEFSDLDICELCCDMQARSKDNGIKTIKYFKEKILPNSKLIEKRKDDIVFIFKLLTELDKQQNVW